MGSYRDFTFESKTVIINNLREQKTYGYNEGFGLLNNKIYELCDKSTSLAETLAQNHRQVCDAFDGLAQKNTEDSKKIESIYEQIEILDTNIAGKLTDVQSRLKVYLDYINTLKTFVFKRAPIGKNSTEAVKLLMELKNKESQMIFCRYKKEVAINGLINIIEKVINAPKYRMDALTGKWIELTKEEYLNTLKLAIKEAALGKENKEFVELIFEKLNKSIDANSVNNPTEIQAALLMLSSSVVGKEYQIILDSLTKNDGHIFSDKKSAAIDAGKKLISQTLIDNLEYMASIYKKEVLKYDIQTGTFKLETVYTYNDIRVGEHDNVRMPTLYDSLINRNQFKNNANIDAKFSVIHIHPNCFGHTNDQFSGTGDKNDIFGDKQVVTVLGASEIYLVEPSSGLIFKFDGGVDIGDVNARIKKIATTYTKIDSIYIGNTGITIPNKKNC